MATRNEVLKEAIRAVCPDCRRRKKLIDGSHAHKDAQGFTYFVICSGLPIWNLMERRQ